VRPLADDPLDVCLRHAVSAEDALAKIFALGGDSDVAGVWVGGRRVKALSRDRRARAWYAGRVRKSGNSSPRAERTKRSRARAQ